MKSKTMNKNNVTSKFCGERNSIREEVYFYRNIYIILYI